MVVKSAEFITSIANAKDLSNFDILPQFAFVGRSNVGKSSLLNALVQRNKLAKTSSTPGRTRLLNIFEVNKKIHFVDLPGYGFAKASKSEQQNWQHLIGDYFENSKQLKHVFVLVDCRHKPSEKDEQMLKYLYIYQIPFTIIATKIDKLSKNELRNNLNMLASSLGVGVANIIAVSSSKKIGMEKVWQVIDEKIEQV